MECIKRKVCGIACHLFVCKNQSEHLSSGSSLKTLRRSFFSHNNLQTDIFELICILLLCHLTSYKSQNCFYASSSFLHLVHKNVLSYLVKCLSEIQIHTSCTAFHWSTQSCNFVTKGNEVRSVYRQVLTGRDVRLLIMAPVPSPLLTPKQGKEAFTGCL